MGLDGQDEEGAVGVGTFEDLAGEGGATGAGWTDEANDTLAGEQVAEGALAGRLGYVALWRQSVREAVVPIGGVHLTSTLALVTLKEVSDSPRLEEGRVSRLPRALELKVALVVEDARRVEREASGA